MGDVQFPCPNCGQVLLADQSAAGMNTDCPHCGATINVPVPDDADEVSALNYRIQALEAQLAEMRTALEEASEGSGSKALLADALQQLRRGREEHEALAAERDALQTELDNVTSRLSQTEQTVGSYEGRALQAEGELGRWREQLEATKAERNALAQDAERSGEELSEVRKQLEELQAERMDHQATLTRATKNLESSQQQLQQVQEETDKLEAELGQARIDLSESRQTLSVIQAERDKLAAEVSLDHDLTRFLEMKSAFEEAAKGRDEAVAELSEAREKLGRVTQERDALHKQSVELELKLAATREAVSGTQLQQDNEILRALVERLNQEIKELSPSARHPHGSSHNH